VEEEFFCLPFQELLRGAGFFAKAELSPSRHNSSENRRI